jgi:putative intracellular protease/amidase
VITPNPEALQMLSTRRASATRVTLLVMSFLLLAAGLAVAEEPASSRPLNVAIVLYDGVELLDFAGPGEVFEIAGGYGGAAGRDGTHVYTVARDRNPIVSQGFVDVVPDHSIEDAPPPDVLVLPGGGVAAMVGDEAFMAWANKAAGDSQVTLTVCTGAFILGETGRLDGRDVTTWYGALNNMARRFPEARVHPGRRFVDSGDVVTTAGVSAGIDGALHVVARLFGRPVAEQTARYMEYHWSPEAYLAGSYPIDNPRLSERDRLAAEADRIARGGDWQSAATRYRDLLAEDPSYGYAWYRLGLVLHTAGRLDEAIPAHRKAAESDDYRARGLYNLGCALALQGDTAGAVAALEEAFAAGFPNALALRNDTDLASLQGDPAFEVLVEKVLG